MGTGKYTPNAAVSGDMGWQPASIKQWKVVCTHWHRMMLMPSSRLNKRIFIWIKSKANRSCKNWCFRVSELLSGLDLNKCVSGPFPFSKAAFLQQVIKKLEQRHHAD